MFISVFLFYQQCVYYFMKTKNKFIRAIVKVHSLYVLEHWYKFGFMFSSNKHSCEYHYCIYLFSVCERGLPPGKEHSWRLHIFQNPYQKWNQEETPTYQLPTIPVWKHAVRKFDKINCRAVWPSVTDPTHEQATAGIHIVFFFLLCVFTWFPSSFCVWPSFTDPALERAST